jgi:hypothetical protein
MPVLIVCGTTPIPGSVERTCEICHCTVQLSPLGQATEATSSQQVRIACDQCTLAEMEAGAQPRSMTFLHIREDTSHDDSDRPWR